MGLLQQMADGAFEQVVHCHDPGTGLRAIVAIHSTRLGPALGGTRCYPYPDEAAALTDVLRLSRGMTYKAAAAGLDLGGGKAVIIGDPASVKTEALLRAYGRFVDTLGGRYLTAEDVGTTQADMDTIRKETVRVTGVSPAFGGSGDPSDATAEGVVCAMRAVGELLAGAASLAGVRVVVSGVGKVGSGVVRRLVAEGATVTISDIDPARTRMLQDELGIAVTGVDVGEAHRAPCDIFSPCALGGVLTARSIPELSCRAVVGAANNQLGAAADAGLLAARGITYAPDFIVNAGGIINIAEELSSAGYDRVRALQRVANVGRTLRAVLDEATATGRTTLEVAEALAERRIRTLDGIRHLRTFP